MASIALAKASSLAIVIAVAGRVQADEPVELRYRAPAECPASTAVEAAVRERAPTVRFAAGAPRVFEIAIEPRGDQFAGTLRVNDTADRELTAHRCDDLVTALSLVTALAIDPSSMATTASPATRPSKRDGTAGIGLETGATPDPLVVATLAGRLGLGHDFDVEVAVMAGRDGTMQDGASAEFTLFAARPSACWTLVRWRDLTTTGCAQLELGVLRATGDDIVNSRGLTRVWSAGGARLGARWPAGSRVFAQLDLGLSIPFVRDRFIFAPDVEIHRTDAVSSWTSLGVGVRFP